MTRLTPKCRCNDIIWYELIWRIRTKNAGRYYGIANWFMDAIHLRSRKYCARTNWEILKPPNFADARGVTNFFKCESFIRHLFLGCASKHIRERPTTGFNFFRVIFCHSSAVTHFFRRIFFNFLLLVSFVSRRDRASVFRNHSIYLHAKSWVKSERIRINSRQKYCIINSLALKEKRGSETRIIRKWKTDPQLE